MLKNFGIKKALNAYKNEMMKYPNSRSVKGLKNLAHYEEIKLVSTWLKLEILRIIKK